MQRSICLFSGFAAVLVAASLCGRAEPPRTKLKPHPHALPNPHPPGKVDNQKLVPFIVKSPGSLPGIVVDETEAKLVGSWRYSTHTPPYVGLGYLHDQKLGKGKSSVTFTPNLPKGGTYEVRLSHCYNIRRAANTPVTIHHADGDTTIRINQQQVPNYNKLFRPLGRFRFLAGKKGWVRISTGGTKGKYVIADAVQFLPVAAEKSAPARRQKSLSKAEYLHKAYVLRQGIRPPEGFTGTWRTWHKNGQPKTERPLVNGINHGLCKQWNVRDKLIATGKYRKGREFEGTFRHWYYLDGDTAKHCYSVGAYRAGVRHGEYSEWTVLGQKLAEGRFVNDKRAGRWRKWNLKGKPIADGFYKDDRPWSGTFAIRLRTHWIISDNDAGKKE